MIFKRILPVFLFNLFTLTVVAQQKDNYAAAWKKIDTLIISKGLTKTALTEVNKVYELAKKEQNDAQIMKALVYRIGLQQEIEEDADKKNISMLEKEIPSLKEPARSILNSLVAESYWKYFRQRRYYIYNRSATINFKKDDINTWSAQDFNKKISELYLASLADEKLLQQT